MRLRRAAGALALLVAACNGSDDEPRITAAQFAAETCDDLGPWGTALDGSFASGTFEAARHANQELRDKVEARAAPDVEGGDDVKGSLLDTIDALDDALSKGDEAEIESALEALDPTGGNPELRRAFSEATACDAALSNLG